MDFGEEVTGLLAHDCSEKREKNERTHDDYVGS